MNTLRIATRKSQLAMWQAEHVKALLEQAHPALRCEILGMSTQGDRDKASPLSRLGGKGVFVKELETALLDGTADIAVHSMKDVPGELPEGLAISAIVEREDPRDAFVSNHFRTLSELPAGATLGSSSLRRVLQVRTAFPGLAFSELRGNVDTRLRKLDEGEYDGIILAVAGLKRLGLESRIAERISTDVSIPAAGQGAVGIESRLDDVETGSLLAAVNHEPTATRVHAERDVTRVLGATCNLPVAVFAEIDGQQIRLTSFVADTDGVELLREETEGSVADAPSLAEELGARLLSKGAARLMSAE